MFIVNLVCFNMVSLLTILVPNMCRIRRFMVWILLVCQSAHEMPYSVLVLCQSVHILTLVGFSLCGYVSWLGDFGLYCWYLCLKHKFISIIYPNYKMFMQCKCCLFYLRGVCLKKNVNDKCVQWEYWPHLSISFFILRRKECKGFAYYTYGRWFYFM